MARGTPGTAGSKGGGNVIPSNQMMIGDNSYRGPSPFGSQRQIPPRGYTNIFSAPRQPTPPRFGGRGGSSGFMAGANTYGRMGGPIFNPRPSPYGPITGRFPRGGGQRSPGQTPPPSFPRGRGDFPISTPPFRRPPPSRYPGPYMPSPSNRFLAPLPRPRNPYNPPPNQYGGMRGPSGLAGFLANQPAIRQVEIDPATGFFTQNQVEKDAAARAAAEAAEAAAQAERDRIAQEAADAAQAEKDRLEQEANQQAPVPEADPVTQIPDYSEIFNNEDIRYFSPFTARKDVAAPAEMNVNRLPEIQSDMGRSGGMGGMSASGLPQPLTRDELDARFATMQAQRAAQGVDPTRSPGKAGSKGGASTVPVGGQNNIASKSLSSGVSKGGGMGGTSMPASGGPNIRPAMGVGKATGGPVGLASLAGRY